MDATFLSQNYGMMVNESMEYRFWWLRLNAFLGYFRTKDYESRVYAFEPGLLYTMSFGSYFGEGIRCGLRAKAEIGKHWVLVCKGAMTNISTAIIFRQDYNKSMALLRLIWKFR